MGDSAKPQDVKDVKDVRAVQDFLAGFLPKQPWLEPGDDYAIKVHLWAGDYAIVFAMSKDVIVRAKDLVVRLIKSARSADPQDFTVLDEIAAALSDDALSDDESGQLWLLMDEFFARCLIEWHVPRFSTLRGGGSDSPFGCPNGRMDREGREKIIRLMPVNMIARIVYGALYQSKNF